MAERSRKGFIKALCEKEKLLVTSNFSFYHNVFKTCTADTYEPGLVWERVNSVSYASTDKIKLFDFGHISLEASTYLQGAQVHKFIVL